MRVVFDEKNKVFLLHTQNTTYAIAVTEDKYVNHLYYGKKLEDTDIRYLLREDEAPFTPGVNRREKNSYLDFAPMEYPESGMGDYRESAICVRSMSGYRASELIYEGYEIKKGKPKLPGLPATWGNEEDCITLSLLTRDPVLGMKVVLRYSVFRNQDVGEVYAMNFVYSGNFIAQAEKSQFDSVRMMMGIHPEGFTWKLEPEECFTAPEVILVYSGKGLGKMTRTYHDLYRNHLIRSPYLHRERPILINNWEATYFEFDDKKLLDIAREASKLGIEMLVMDDGWFGKRNSDDSSLGDWVVNEEKINGGLHKLAEDVKKTGMKFGIWVEPEMISPDSDLYKEHPDWAIQIPGREITQSRAQYVLDLSRDEVVDEVYEKIADVLKSADIAYVKWDMNRQLTTMGSCGLPADRQGELYHRYVLGVYKMQERLLQDFPELLLENCSGGGARFDAGMLYYSPQIWCSDDTDAVERLAIQEGTAMVYPVSTIGAHVSVCPNHTVGRITPFETRGNVALLGTFGYELDITKLSAEEKELVKKQTADYHKYNELIREGDYYRLASIAENGRYDSWMIVEKTKKKALVFYVQGMAAANGKSRFVKLKGLKAQSRYRIDGKEYSGSVLMQAGLKVAQEFGDFKSRIFLVEENVD